MPELTTAAALTGVIGWAATSAVVSGRALTASAVVRRQWPDVFLALSVHLRLGLSYDQALDRLVRSGPTDSRSTLAEFVRLRAMLGCEAAVGLVRADADDLSGAAVAALGSLGEVERVVAPAMVDELGRALLAEVPRIQLETEACLESLVLGRLGAVLSLLMLTVGGL